MLDQQMSRSDGKAMTKEEQALRRGLTALRLEVDGSIVDSMTGLVEAALLAEREACAKVADRIEIKQEIDHGAANTGGAAEAAVAIRRREVGKNEG